MSLSLRPARPDDEGLLLAWRNDPEARRAAFQQKPISSADHRTWFAAKLASPDCAIFVVEDDGHAVGQVRLDRANAGAAEIDIAIKPAERGRGYGTTALRLVAEQAAGALAVSRLKATVKLENDRSLRAFRAAGFNETDRDASTVKLTRELSQLRSGDPGG